MKLQVSMNNLTPDSRGYLRTERVTAAGRAAGALAVLVGGAVLLGWALDVAALKSVLPGWVSMKPNTAVAFILTGVALLAFPMPDARTLLSRLSRFCALFAGLIGLLSLSEYVFGWNPGFDQWLFCESAGTVGTSYPGRMAPDSALCFVMLAAGLETARTMRHRSWMLGCTMVLGGLVSALALAAMLNYFTPALGAFGWGGMTLMAVPTAIVFAVLGVALFLVVWPEIAAFCSLGRKTTAAYVLGLVLVVFIGLTSSRSVLWLDETAHRVSHAEQVLGAISDVMSEIAKAQSHTRGYVITGGERYLRAEQTAAARCREALAALRQLISDPAQKARSVRLEAQADELIQWFSQVITARRTGSAGTIPLDITDHGEDLMDSLRALVAQMEDAEMLLLQQWQRDSSNVSRFTQLVIITGTAVGLIIFLSVLFGLNRAETEGRQAQATLAASEVRYRRLFEAARDGVLILDAETGMVVDVNPYLIELLGVTREVFLGRKVWELGFLKDIVANEANFMELQQKHYIRYENMAMEGHDGKRHEVEFVSNVYLVNDQKVIQCNIRDISERKKAEEEIRASETRFRTFFELPLHGKCITSLEKGWLEVNHRLCEILGYTREELVRKTWAEMTHPEDLAADVAQFARILSGEIGQYKLQKRFIRKDGSTVWTEISVGCVRKSDGAVDQIICVIDDITERKDMEANLANALFQANAANNAKSEFLGIMSHELRNPLSGVLGFAQLLSETALDDEQKDYVRTISSSGEHLLAVVNDTLDFSSMEAGTLEIHAAPFDLAHLVKLSSDIVRKSAADKGLAFHCDVAAGVPAQITGDERRVRQILINLLANAVKFTASGSVSFRVTRSGEFLDFSVEDTGIGISPEALARLFQLFTQADSKINQKYGGTGLGLAVSQRLAEAMGGTILVVSAPGKGSMFTFRLPLEAPAGGMASVPSPLFLGADGASPSSPSAETPVRHDGLPVLVVDDDTNSRTLAGKMLQSLGYRAGFAADGAEAVQAFVPGKYLTILMDMAMPLMDGLVATKKIREIEAATEFHVPIIAFTANVMPGECEQYLAAGLDDFLSKPFKRDELAAKLDNVLARRKKSGLPEMAPEGSQ